MLKVCTDVERNSWDFQELSKDLGRVGKTEVRSEFRVCQREGASVNT